MRREEEKKERDCEEEEEEEEEDDEESVDDEVDRGKDRWMDAPFCVCVANTTHTHTDECSHACCSCI